MISKPDLDGNGLSHPARYNDKLLPVFAEILQGYKYVLDPFAGTGKIHDLEHLGEFVTVGVEIEPEWAELRRGTRVGDATKLPWGDGTFDAICTSPCYGNRLADHHDATDGSFRRSYTHDLGRALSANNSGALQWGPEYRALHKKAWVEATRVLRPGGLFVLNVKDHIRQGVRQLVSGWHVTELCRLGMTLQYNINVATPALRQGANRNERIEGEEVYVFEKEVA